MPPPTPSLPDESIESMGCLGACKNAATAATASADKHPSKATDLKFTSVAANRASYLSWCQKTFHYIKKKNRSSFFLSFIKEPLAPSAKRNIFFLQSGFLVEQGID